MIGDVFRARFVFSRSAPDVSPSADLQLVDVFDALGGVTVEGGLYRVYSPQRVLAPHGRTSCRSTAHGNWSRHLIGSR